MNAIKTMRRILLSVLCASVAVTSFVFAGNASYGTVADKADLAGSSATLIGDVNGDTVISMDDYTSMASYIAGKKSPVPVLANSDMDDDGSITTNDLRLLLRYLAFEYVEITDPTFVVSKVCAAPGDTSVAVTVSVKNNPGILGMTLKVNYDDSVMTLKDASNGDALSTINMTKPKNFKDGCNFVWYGEDLSESDIVDGDVLNLVFDISESAAAGTYPVSISYDAGEILDAGLNELELDIINGSCTVNGEAGDGDDDNEDDNDTEQITAPTFIVDKITAKAGDTSVTATVSVKNNPGILGMTLKVNYDSSVMTLKSASNGDALAAINMTKPKNFKDGCNFVWYGEDLDDSDIVDGAVLNLVFDIAANAPAGTYPISISYDPGEIFDAALGEITLDIKNGNVTIAG